MKAHRTAMEKNPSIRKTLIVCSSINMIYVVIEAVVGFRSGAVGLISDAGHNLSDVVTLLLSLWAIYNPKKSDKIFVINALLLIVAVLVILVESVAKLANPATVSGETIFITAGVGIVVNGITAFILMKNSAENRNIKVSFLHMIADTFVSLGVVLSGIVIKYTGIYLIDPIVSILISVVILISAVKLFSKS
ncbi:MAG: cation transporter [Paludibacteraceae bacterium]|nr:cation transporter [Paludibacteraceae bacterium]